MHFSRSSFFRCIVFSLIVALTACGGDSGSNGKKSRYVKRGSSAIPSSTSNVGPAPWAKQLGSAGVYTYENAVTTDLSGNVYITGTIGRGLDGNRLTGTSDFFLTKYDPAGTKVFTKQMGVPEVATWGVAVATDALSNVYVAGTTFGGLDGNELTGTCDFFLTMYNSAGIKVYTKQMGVPGVATWGLAVATDRNDNVYVAGITFGGLDDKTLTGKSDFFLTKYSATGAKVYTKQMGVAGADTYGEAVETDENGNVFVSGLTSGGLDGNMAVASWDSFFTKFDKNGNKLFTKQPAVAKH